MEATIYKTEPEVSVLVHSQRPEGPARGEIILVHGLEGSSAAGYASPSSWTSRVEPSMSVNRRVRATSRVYAGLLAPEVWVPVARSTVAFVTIR